MIFAEVCGRLRCGLMQPLASGGEVAPVVGVSEQTTVTDAMKARRQHMQQEATHELLKDQGHRFVSCAAVVAVVLPTERDAAIIIRDEP